MLSVVLKKQLRVTLTAAQELLTLLKQFDIIFGVSNHFFNLQNRDIWQDSSNKDGQF